jgi:Leucine-rich repeat (LRR) protein
MAQLFPDDIVNSPDLSQLSHALCKIFEKNLSDEWECHAILDGPEISHFIVVSPDLGVLTLLISKCQPEQFDSFFQSIPELQQNCLSAIRNELQKNEHFCDENGALNFPIGFGILFPELSSGEVNISVGALSQFSIFADKLKEVSNSDDELEELLFDMVEEVDFDELGQENLQAISNVIPQMYTSLINGELESTDNNIHSELSGWWDSLDAEWQNIFLKTVQVSSEMVTNETIEAIQAIKSLDASKTDITDIAPVKHLKHLTTLALNETAVRDLSPLRHVSSLEALGINGIQTTDIDPVSTLSELRYLSMVETIVTDLTPLSKLCHLEFLGLIDSKVADLEPIKHIKSLKFLTITGCKIQDLESVRKLSNLVSLVVDHTEVTNLAPISDLVELKTLGFEHTRIESLAPLRKLSNLEKLFFSNTLVENISPIAGLSNLKEVCLEDSKVKDIGPLRCLNKLKVIKANHLGITDIDTFREKYPLPTEQETCTSTADTPQQETNHSHTNEGDNEMHKNRGIEHFVNHLELLGYENEKLDIKDRAGFLCQRPNKMPLFLFSAVEFGIIIFRCQWTVENIIDDSQKTEVINLLNNFNADSFVTCNFLDDENNVVAHSMLLDIYSKVDFGRFLELLTAKIDECVTITSELESKFAGKGDDIPF